MTAGQKSLKVALLHSIIGDIELLLFSYVGRFVRGSQRAAEKKDPEFSKYTSGHISSVINLLGSANGTKYIESASELRNYDSHFHP